MINGEAWLIAIVGGAFATVLAAGMLLFLRKTRSAKVWHAIARAIGWPLSLRLTTRHRLDSLTAQVVSERQEAARVRGVAAERLRVAEQEIREARSLQAAGIAAAEASARAELEKVQSLAKEDALRAHRLHLEANERAREMGRALGRAEAMAEVEAQRAVRRPQPVWRVDEVQGQDTFTLRNTQPEVELRDVSLQAPLGDFVFDGPSQWPGPSSGVVTFQGRRQRNGRSFGVKFVVRWHDANGDPRMGEVFLEGEPRRAHVL